MVTPTGSVSPGLQVASQPSWTAKGRHSHFKPQLYKAPTNTVWPHTWPCFEQDHWSGRPNLLLRRSLTNWLILCSYDLNLSARFHFLLEERGRLSYMMCNTLLMEEELLTKHMGIWEVIWMSRYISFHRRSHGWRLQVSMTEMRKKHFRNVLYLQIREPKGCLHRWKYPFPHEMVHLKGKKAHQRKRPIGSNAAQLKLNSVQENTRQHWPLVSNTQKLPPEIPFFWKEQKCSRRTGGNFLPPVSRGPATMTSHPALLWHWNSGFIITPLTWEFEYRYPLSITKTEEKGVYMFKCWKSHPPLLIPGEVLISSDRASNLHQTNHYPSVPHIHKHRVFMDPVWNHTASKSGPSFWSTLYSNSMVYKARSKD